MSFWWKETVGQCTKSDLMRSQRALIFDAICDIPLNRNKEHVHLSLWFLAIVWSMSISFEPSLESRSMFINTLRRAVRRMDNAHRSVSTKILSLHRQGLVTIPPNWTERIFEREKISSDVSLGDIPCRVRNVSNAIPRRAPSADALGRWRLISLRSTENTPSANRHFREMNEKRLSSTDTPTSTGLVWSSLWIDLLFSSKDNMLTRAPLFLRSPNDQARRRCIPPMME
jgi:hypothetical protein